MSAFDIPRAPVKKDPAKKTASPRTASPAAGWPTETLSKPGVTPSRVVNWKSGEYKPDQRMSEALERARAEQPALLSMGESPVPLSGQPWR